jgi:hypothetical protein
MNLSMICFYGKRTTFFRISGDRTYICPTGEISAAIFTGEITFFKKRQAKIWNIYTVK